MDLYAYSQIENLEGILKDNNINIPRLRGLRLMAKEKRVTDKELDDLIKEEKKDYLVSWLRQHNDFIISFSKDNKHHKAFIYKGKNQWGEKEVVGYDFSKVHGKDRKHIKFKWKQIEKAYRSQYDLFNKYAGKNVLYVHARLGSTNWSTFKIDTKHPMYLGMVDDAFDTSYCDIYYDLSLGVKEVVK